MKENFLYYLEALSFLDFIFLFFLIFNSLLSFGSGFVLSLLSFLKWILAIILTKIFFPFVAQYTENLISSEFAHDIIFGSTIFILSLFFIILISKGLKKTIKWTGLGNVDKFFGLVFGILKGYLYFVSIFTFFNFLHPYEKWNKNFNEGFFFNTIIYGNQILSDNLPKRYEYIDKSREKIDKITK